MNRIDRYDIDNGYSSLASTAALTKYLPGLSASTTSPPVAGGKPSGLTALASQVRQGMSVLVELQLLVPLVDHLVDRQLLQFVAEQVGDHFTAHVEWWENPGGWTVRPQLFLATA